MDIIKPFGKISKRDTLLAGGKGASLGEMTRAGIPVPGGFVVLSKAFDRFIEETDLVAEIDSILHSVNLKEVHTVEDASERIHSLILDADMPKDIASEIKRAFKDLDATFVAVRSSATAEDSSTAAWAGQLETYLNTTGKTLLENVKECWASLFTPRAIVYRIEKKLHKSKISVAVVVQKMIQSEASGVAFSVHPVTQDKNQIIIEAGFGLGEAVVSGAITPDSYVVEKKENSMLSKSVEFQKKMLVRSRKGGNEWKELTQAVGERQVLADKHILELSKLVAKIEKHYGFPVDIEWAFENGKFYILQSRPITTLIKGAGVQKTGEEPVLQRLKSLSWRHWLDRPYGPFIVTLGYAGVGPKYFSRIGLDGFGFVSNLYQYPDIYKSERLVKENTDKLRIYFRKHSIFNLSRLLSKTHSENVKEIGRIIASKDTPIHKLSLAREKIRLYFPFLWIIDPLEDYYMSKIDSIVPSYIKGDIQKWVGDVSVPEKKNAYVLMQDALRKEPVEKVREKFSWLKSRDGFTEFYTLGELKEIKLQFKELKKHNVVVPKELKGLAEELKELSFFRADRTDKFYELLGLCRPIFQEVAESLSISFKELAFYDVDSIIAGKPRKIPIPFNFLYLDGKQSIRQEKFIEFAKSAEGEIRGTAAYTGIVRGIVKIIRHPSELDKIDEGDVLVAQMTFPAFISAMHKAVAFVTDEGSITCHAAIVAREMKKPCIIGTKNATKILKDGDLVEVDADKGIVRVISGKQKPKTLVNTYSRERSLIYFCMWDDCDRKAMKMIGEDINASLFIMPKRGEKGSVWYERDEIQYLTDRCVEVFRSRKNNPAWDDIVKITDRSWKFFEPYMRGKKTISSLEEFDEYYNNLSDSWISMNSFMFHLIEDKRINPAIRKYLEKLRLDTQEYTERIGQMPLDYLEKHMMPKELSYFITKDEAMELLRGRKGNLSDIKSRQNGCFRFNGKIHLLNELDDVLVRNNLAMEKADKAIDEIKGTTAFKGVVQGTARIVDGMKDLGKVTPGDILVTQMTNPKYLSAIMRASAIVTDEGSMLCHAAITARELGKPCIIGTKIASKIINDGDLIEVNADKGIVKILVGKGEGEKLNAQTWQNSIRWKYDAYPFFTSVYMLLAEKPTSKYYTRWQFISHFHDGGLEAYIPKKELIDKGNLIIQELVEGNDSYYKELKRVSADMQRTMESCLHYSKARNIEDINSWWLPIKRTLSEVGNILFSFDFALNEFLEDMKISAPDEFEALSSNIIEPKNSFISEAGSLLKKLVIKYDGDFNRIHPEFVDKLGWLQNSYKGVFNLDKNWVKNYYKQNEGKTDSRLGHKIKRLDKKYSLLAKTSSLAISFRDDKKKLLLLAVDVMERWLRLTCKKHNLSFEDMKWLSIDEVLDVIENKTSGNISRAHKFNSKKTRYCLMGPKYYEDISPDLFEEIRTLYAKSIGMDEIKGSSANKGIVRGKAKIILDPKREGRKLKTGDILVTSMTRPEYLPLMNIASAFVTDEGGVTCHAAIIARETGKPCITGTKFATQVLKDGDLIEVDADNGIVRIIKKS